jgi:PncC family amidohydrolase
MFNRESVEKVRKPLLERRQTIAVAESVTAGLLQAALASAEEASKVFQGGITVYNIGQKCRHLAIDPIHAADCNCVSAKMATDMATSVAKLFTAHWGIGITGYATPVPESGNQIFAHFSIALNGEEKLSRRIEGGDRIALDAQLHYIEEVLRALEEVL